MSAKAECVRRAPTLCVVDGGEQIAENGSMAAKKGAKASGGRNGKGTKGRAAPAKKRHSKFDSSAKMALVLKTMEAIAKNRGLSNDVRVSAKEALEELAAEGASEARSALARVEECEALMVQMGLPGASATRELPYVDEGGRFVMPTITPTRARELARNGR